jgi:MFS family permease
MDSYPDSEITTSATEDTPLIGHGREDPPDISSNERNRPRVLFLTIIFLYIIDWASFMGEAPQLAIFEDIICNRIYRGGDSTAFRDTNSDVGRDCTINSVQSELALITQILSATNVVPSIFLTIPYGALADRIGRRPVLWLSMVGLCLQDLLIRCITWWPSIFPLWLVWLTPLTTFIGGGAPVGYAMLNLAVADVVGEHERAIWFSRMSVAVLIGEISAGPAASVLMQLQGPWFPYMLSALLSILAIPLLFLFPETNPAVIARKDDSSNSHTPSKSIVHQLKLAIRRTSKSLGSVLSSRNVVLILLSYFVAAIAHTSSLDIQFMRQRFKWKFSAVSCLLHTQLQI